MAIDKQISIDALTQAGEQLSTYINDIITPIKNAIDQEVFLCDSQSIILGMQKEIAIIDERMANLSEKTYELMGIIENHDQSV